MRRTLSLCALALLAVVPFGRSAPLDGPEWTRQRIAQGGTLELVRAFAGGQRATVIAIGDHRPVVNLTITVYDARDNVVARDEGSGPAGDFVAAVWYPPREGRYRVVLHNAGVEYNDVAIAVK